jgi:hypothetical protein
MCQQTSCSTEETECRYNVRQGESLKVVLRGTVNKDESILISANRDTVAKCNVHVDSIQVTVFSAIEQAAAFGFWKCGIRTKGGGKLTTVHPFSVMTDLKEMFIILNFQQPIILWSSSTDQWVFVSEALAVSHGRTGGKDVPGWGRRRVIYLEDIVERRRDTGESSESV